MVYWSKVCVDRIRRQNKFDSSRYLMCTYRIRHSIELRDWIYVKGNGFISFAKKLELNLSIKYEQKLLDTTRKSAADAFKTTLKKSLQTSRSNCWLVGNKTADKIIIAALQKTSKSTVYCNFPENKKMKVLLAHLRLSSSNCYRNQFRANLSRVF